MNPFILAEGPKPPIRLLVVPLGPYPLDLVLDSPTRYPFDFREFSPVSGLKHFFLTIERYKNLINISSFFLLQSES
jgi:hypothetical protein